jgi:poly-gamma-glutamate synthesis protein (capsule biosynthesis protein)
MLTMCNNHALDGWYDGLQMSLDYADAAGLAHVGAYRTQEEHDTPEIYDIGGIKVGMVNYTQFTNGMAEKSDKEATIYGMRLMAGADYEGDIADLKNAGAEFTIAIMHWGTEYVQEPDDDIEAIARRLVAAGVDLVIGGHPHVVQPAEYVTATQADGTQNTALVIYSLGNFYSEHRKSNTDNGVIFEFTLSDDGQGGIEMSSPALIPIYMWQAEGAGAYEFRAVPSGVYLNNPPAGMSDSQHRRMVESYNETVELIGGVVEIKAD